ncbi:hypothetical protein [Furfurilactobacillus entadae]|uniref:hypothetical protein n=1 Tax=Furfurilactobacillus entadae TaxID=2922307 RepID=UPI0035F0BB50
MDQLLPNTYISYAKHRLVRPAKVAKRHTQPTMKQRLRSFFTAERGDTLTHPQLSADAIIETLDDALAHHAVVSIMLNQADVFARHLTTVTGTLRQDHGVLTLTNHASQVVYIILPEQIRDVCYGMMVA